MITAGIDVGSRLAKAVILKDGNLEGQNVIRTEVNSAKTAEKVIKEALAKTDFSFDDIQYTVATGYGRVVVPFANKVITEISCYAKGTNWVLPSARTILDVGGEDSKVINCDEKGRVTNFAMNDKCAGGTGRFLELIANHLQIPMEEIGKLSLQSNEDIPFNTTCVVWQKSEAMIFLKEGIAKSDILAGVHDALAARITTLISKISFEKEVAFAGGVSHNEGMVKKIEEKIGSKVQLAPERFVFGALGAAIFAREICLAK